MTSKKSMLGTNSLEKLPPEGYPPLGITLPKACYTGLILRCKLGDILEKLFFKKYLEPYYRW
jgi:hypothetical protein